MHAPERILAAIESDNHGATVVDKAVRLGDRADAQLVFARRHFDTVIDEPEILLTAWKPPASAPARVPHRSSVEGPLDPAWDSTREWSSRICQRLLELAQERQCDLIIKDAFVRHGNARELIHTAHDWNLLHHADVPVMMLKPRRWASGKGAAVVAALDVFDSGKRELNADIVSYAHELTELVDGRLHLVNALPLSSGAALEYGVTDLEQWRDEFRRGRLREMQRLTEESHAAVRSMQVVTGVPWKAVARVVAQLDAEFLVIGQVRPGAQAYLGTTSELLLHAVGSDVVSVP